MWLSFQRRYLKVPKSITHQLWWIIAGTKGGITRAKIIIALKEQPLSANQLTELLKLDYKTIRYHLDLLTDNKLLITAGKKYGLMYFISPELESNFETFLEIWNRIGKGKS